MTEQQKVDDWNRDNETGRVVEVRPEDGIPYRTVTRSSAILTDGGNPVIWVEAAWGGRLFPLELVDPYDGVGDIPDADRAGGGAICPDCGRALRDHPADLEHLDKGGIPFLTRLCNGRIVKL